MHLLAWVKRHYVLSAFVLYCALAVLMTLPLALHAITHIPGNAEEDGGLFVWNAWVFSEAAVHGQGFMHTGQVFAPEGASLLFHTRTTVHDALIALLAPVAGFVLAFNIVFYLSFAVSGLGMLFLVRHLTGHRGAAVIGGFLFAFAPIVLVRALGHFTLLAVWPFPWFIYFFLLFQDTLRYRYALGAGIVFSLSCYNGLQYPVFLALLAGALGVMTIFGHRMPQQRKRALAGCGLVLLAVLLLAVPLLFQYAQAWSSGEALERTQRITAFHLSADAVRYLLPSALHPVLGAFSAMRFSLKNSYDAIPETTQFLGWSVLFLALLGFVHAIRRQKRMGFWAALGIVGFLFSLGPAQPISSAGKLLLLPYYAFMDIPVINFLRAPNRYSLFVLLAVVVFASFALAELFRNQRLGPRGKTIAGVALLLAFAFEYLAVPFPITDTRPPAVYAVLPTEPAGAILQVPFGIRDGRRSAGERTGELARYQLWQAEHRWPQVGGYLSRVPDRIFSEYGETPGLRYFLDAGESIQEDFQPTLVRQTFIDRGIAFIVFAPQESLLPERRQWYIEHVIGAERIAEQDGRILYAVPTAVADSLPDSLFTDYRAR
jgi:hypothetical protein